jgi:predicted transcriptional regulator
MHSASTTSLKLDPDMKARIQRLAVARRRSSHWIMREAIDEYVSREEKRQSFLQAAVAAWEDYQKTGLYLTQEEADTWMAKLEAGEDAPIPECHI